MQVFLILFSIYFAHNQPLILNPYIELTLINYLGMDERLAVGIPVVLVIIAFIGWIIIKEVKK